MGSTRSSRVSVRKATEARLVVTLLFRNSRKITDEAVMFESSSISRSVKL